jgi:hypothetical protein
MSKESRLCNKCPFQRVRDADTPDGFVRVQKVDKEYTVVIVRTVRAGSPEEAADVALTAVGMHSVVDVYAADSGGQEQNVLTMMTGNGGQYFRTRSRT